MPSRIATMTSFETTMPSGSLMPFPAVSEAAMSRCQTPATNCPQPSAYAGTPCSATRKPGRFGHVPVSDICNKSATASRSLPLDDQVPDLVDVDVEAGVDDGGGVEL